jgi:hypothetical protein
MSEFSRAYALSGSNLTSFDPTNPAAGTTIAITGVSAGETLVGIDVRPANGRLYSLGVDAVADTATLYVIATQTGVATPVGPPISAIGDLPFVGYGMDFNPQVDRIRITTDSGLNFRINPNNGALAGLDPNINGAATGVAANAYTNNELGATATTLYTLDSVSDVLMIQNGNAGTQFPIAPVHVGPINLDFSTANGFDIPAGVNVTTSGSPASGSALALLTVGGSTGLYRIDLATAAATGIGPFGSGFTPVNGLAVLNGPLGPDDVVWQHVDGIVVVGERDVGLAPVGFQIRAVGDFDGDGDADLLLRDDDAAVVTWELENGDFVSQQALPDASVAWQAAGTGDFDDDGDDDILWHNADGRVVTWEMQGGSYVVNHNLPAAGSGWEIRDTGDFDRDGDDDILWHNTDGRAVIWEMENGGFVVNHNLGVGSSGWQIASAGDFDGDDDSDILWHHASGAVTIWEIEDGALVTNHNQPAAGVGWQIEGAHDFDDDGDDDILWRNTDGRVVTWEMQDGNFVTNHNFGATASGWEIRGTGDLA